MSPTDDAKSNVFTRMSIVTSGLSLIDCTSSTLANLGYFSLFYSKSEKSLLLDLVLYDKGSMSLSLESSFQHLLS